MPLAGISMSLAGLAAQAARAGAIASVAGGGGGIAGGVGNAVASAMNLALLTNAVRLAVVGLTALAAAVKKSVDALSNFGQQQLTMAASGIETGTLRILGRALGIGDVSGSAGRLRAATLSGLGAATAARFGVPIQPLDVGTAANTGQMLIRALDGLRTTFQTQGMGAAVAAARNLNIEDWLQVVYLTTEQMGRLRKMAENQTGLFSQENVANATRLKFEFALLGSAIEGLVLALGVKLIPAIKLATMALTDPKEAIAKLGRMNPFTNPNWMKEWQEGTAKPLDQNTKALRDNTDMMGKIPGLYGGGPRAVGAMPGAFGLFGGFYLNDALKHGTAAKFGAFGVP